MADTVIYCDGACEPVNPGGIATYGWVIYYRGKKARWGSGEYCRGEGATNNVAEYAALIKALTYLDDKGYHERIEVCSDSQLLVNQMNGDWDVKSPKIAPLWLEANQLVEKFKSVKFRWIPGRDNTEADDLSRKAYAHAKQLVA